MDRVNAALTTFVVLILIGMGSLIFQKPEPQQVSRKKMFSAFYNKNESKKSQHLRKSSVASASTPSSAVSESQGTTTASQASSESRSLTSLQSQLLTPEIREAFLQKLADLQYQQRKQNEFLKRKVGLSDDQIKMVHLKTFMLQKELKTAKLLEEKRIPAATAVKKSAIERHIVWMSYTIGAQNFEEYLNL